MILAPRTAVLVLAAAAALTACSSNGSTANSPKTMPPGTKTTSPGTTTSALGSPSASPSAALTAQQAARLASAGVLRPADLVGYSAKPQTTQPGDAAMEHRLQACVGRPRPSYLARNKGLAFTKGSAEIDSSADVVDSAASAAADLAALKAKGASCMRSELAPALAAQGVTVTSFSATPVPLTVSGSDGAFGFRLAMTARAGGQSVNFGGYELGALVGPAEIDISVLVAGRSSFRLATAVDLLRTATQRARAAA